MRYQSAGALTLTIAIVTVAARADVESTRSKDIASITDAPESVDGRDIFDAADPEAAADVRFDFTGEIDLRDIDLVETLGADLQVVTLIASAGAVRTYAVAPRPVYDVALYGPAACDPLDLAMFIRPRAGIVAQRDLSAPPLLAGGMRLEVRFTSDRRDNIGFIPAPGSALLAVMGAIAFVRRRR